jgi:CheY-like chemotaxis protein
VNTQHVVLVVEDQDMVISVLKEGLTEAGFAVKTVMSGDEAMAAIDAAGMSISTLITDIISGWSKGGILASPRAR